MKKLHSGFTIAELLLSMLVVIIVATAMVPIIGPKKVKVPNIHRAHGIFECYYDADGVTLMQYYANNRGLKDAQPEPAKGGDHCVFSPPSADRYVIYAIGAGSNGYVNEDEINFRLSPDEGSLGGDIYLDTFSESFARIKTDFDEQGGTHYGEAQGAITLNSEVRNLFDEWATNRKQAGSNLYIAFQDLKAPVGAGGRGIARRNVIDQCLSACQNNTADCIGPYNRPGGGYYSSDEHTVAVDSIHNSGTMACYYYVHARGGDSIPGRGSRNGDTILIPIDGYTANEGGLVLNFSDLFAEISSTTRADDSPIGNTVRITLASSAKGGTDAKVKHYLSGLYTLEDGSTPNIPQGPFDEITNPNSLAKVLNNGQISAIPNIGNHSPKNINNNTDVFPRQNRYINHGATHGDEAGGGGFLNGASATKGSAKYENKAFSWKYTSLNAEYHYGSAGVPGEVKWIAYNNLRGNLYLYPGFSNADGHKHTIVTKDTNTDNEDAYVISANSMASAGHIATMTRPVVPGNFLPNSDVIVETVPKNDQLSEYISVIKAAGFLNGLYNCGANLDEPACPGFAGSGAYPLMTVLNAPNTLSITDNQPYTRALTSSKGINRGNRNAPYDIHTYYKNVNFHQNNSEQNMHCADDKIEPNVKNEKFYDAVNQMEYEEKYCTGSLARRGNGAVIIVW